MLVTTVTTPLPLLTRPLRDLASWAAHIQRHDLPILPSTASMIEELREREDHTDAAELARAVARDPFMTLKVLAKVGELRRGKGGTPVETVTAALVMLGVSPFFRHFGPQPTIREVLQDHRDARIGLRDVMQRAQRAAAFAMAFAVHRMDHDTDLIFEAALLHDFTEMLLWVFAPALAQQIEDAKAADPTLRSAAAQQAVLGIELLDLQQTLMKRWHLSELLANTMDDHHASTPQTRNVVLAARLARHSARGWDNPALPDDTADIAALLNLGHEPTLRLLHEIDRG
jgi:HD-like signal output (HDOD) protein